MLHYFNFLPKINFCNKHLVYCDDMNFETIGKNIRHFRSQMGLSQAEVAEFLAVTREHISYYETGRRNIPVGALEKLTELFGVELADLLAEDLAEASVTTAFAFRADALEQEDLEVMASFQKIVRNYLKLHRLQEEG